MNSVCTSSIVLGCLAICLSRCAPDAPAGAHPESLRPLRAVPSPAMAEYSAWSTPVNLERVNSTSNEQNPQLSKDGLAIYFTSDRPAGGLGGLDLWVTRRASLDSPWEPPVNFGEPINTASADFAPNLSIDGHLLFFTSNRPGGHGGNDLYVSRRDDPNDDAGWSVPVNLGAGVNTSDNEQAPNYHQNAEEGAGNLYFNRGNQAAGRADLYYAAVSRDGEARGPAVFVAELNTAAASETAASLRHDGKEVFFTSTRSDGRGSGDIWTSTRQNANDPWSAPVNVESLNTSFNDTTPNLSFDGLTLIFASNRPGKGGNDLWITTRIVRQRAADRP
jgi:WD40-like Beta Propeller Repeat